jgi:hypothetical protein
LRQIVGTKRRRALLAIGSALALLWVALLAYAFDGDEDADAARKDGQPVVQQEILYSYDFFDERRVAGYSRDVFVGRVVGVVGHEPLKTSIPKDNEGPQTQYAIEVTEVLKGSLSPGESLTVNQLGGRDEESGKTIVVEGVRGDAHATDALLKPGGEYLLATVPNPELDWHTITAQPTGDVPLDEDRRGILAEWRAAVENEIPPSTEVGG